MHAQSPPAAVPQTTSAKLPAVSFPYLRLDSENRLEPVKYFTWKARLLAQVSTLNLDRFQVLQILLSKAFLPDSGENSAQHVTSLEELFRKLEHQYPSIDSVVPILIKRTVALPPCGADGHKIEMR